MAMEELEITKLKNTKKNNWAEKVSVMDYTRASKNLQIHSEREELVHLWTPTKNELLTRRIFRSGKHPIHGLKESSDYTAWYRKTAAS